MAVFSCSASFSAGESILNTTSSRRCAATWVQEMPSGGSSFCSLHLSLPPSPTLSLRPSTIALKLGYRHGGGFKSVYGAITALLTTSLYREEILEPTIEPDFSKTLLRRDKSWVLFRISIKEQFYFGAPLKTIPGWCFHFLTSFIVITRCVYSSRLPAVVLLTVKLENNNIREKTIITHTHTHQQTPR